MKDKEKLTDEQIIKAYEHCCLGESCVGCPLEDELGVEQCQQMRRNIFNLINRLKEENAELKEKQKCHFDLLTEKNEIIVNQMVEINNIKAENERLYEMKLDLENQLIEKGWTEYEGADEIEKRVSKETAEKFYDKVMSFIGSNQKFWIVDDEHITIIDVDKLFDFVMETAKQFGVEIKE